MKWTKNNLGVYINGDYRAFKKAFNDGTGLFKLVKVLGNGDTEFIGDFDTIEQVNAFIDGAESWNKGV